ncbi:MAG TPA: DUF1761 domain-containing protein [Gammaproteobacteria bacterium]|nr:DUF1761 domain-containing protein [Gammaproteobacteria bacterium]
MVIEAGVQTMLQINYLAAVAATAAAFVFSGLWYAVFGKLRMALLGNDEKATADLRKVSTVQKLFEILRSFVIVLIVAHLFAVAGAGTLISALQLGLWLGSFPVMILTGATLWDKVPWKLTAIHAGDWLFKVVLVSAILGAWR